MRNRVSCRIVLAACATALLAGSAVADIATATDSAIIQPDGPRADSGGKFYFNVEGLNNGSYASYGILDFAAADLGLGTVSAVPGLRIGLTEAIAGFSVAGPVTFHVSEAIDVDIQPGTSPLRFDTSAAPEEVAGLLSPRHVLGTVDFTPIQTGHLDLFSFRVRPGLELETWLIDQINTAGTIRIVATPGDPDVAATWSGSTGAAPTLEVVPEPSSIAFFAVTAVALVRRRR